MSKVSKKALFVKRSEAAKKGWETRRAKASQASRNIQSGGGKRSKAPSRGVKTTSRAKPTKDSRRQPEGAKTSRPGKSNSRSRVSDLKREIKKLKAEQARERAQIRKANEKALKSIKTAESVIANMARNGVPIRTILKQIPESGREHAKKIIVQTRLDMSSELFEDVRWEAFDLADELDWDISDVFDAWSYDEGTAA